jgi:nicotinamidase-related amidase
MPITLDPATALLLIDLQRGITALPTAHPADDIVLCAAALAIVFREHHLPVVATRVAFSADGGDVVRTRTAADTPMVTFGTEGTVMQPELQLDEHDLLITKRGWNAFYGTELDLQLRRRGITGIVLAGISTSVGVESAARAAAERDYQLTIVTDAVTDTDLGAHKNSLDVIFPKIAELATTDEVIAALDARSPQRVAKTRTANRSWSDLGQHKRGAFYEEL